KNNVVYVFILEQIATALKENGLPDNANLIIYSEKESLKSFLKKVETYQFDRFHLCTVSKQYLLFVHFTPHCNEYYFHVHNVEQFLAKFVPVEKITVYPFAIYEHMFDNSVTNTKLRVCVPGIVNNIRRDYDSLFRILLANAPRLKEKITVDLLGYIPKEEFHF